MKATKLLLAAAVCTSFAALSFAGPSPEYWVRTKQAEKDQAQARAKADVQTKVQPATQVATCAACSCAGMKKS